MSQLWLQSCKGYYVESNYSWENQKGILLCYYLDFASSTLTFSFNYIQVV